jgi:hypothetical protein
LSGEYTSETTVRRLREMTCVILQPSYIPWRGFFHLIHKADVFVFYDDVQYDRHGWRNRNRIKTPRGAQWITIPIKSAGAQWKEHMICDMQISCERKWNEAHFETLRHSYSKAPFFNRYEPMLKNWYGNPPQKLVDFTVGTTMELARELGIRHTRFVRSSSLGCSGTKTDRLVQILERLGGNHYISGPAARDYLETRKLEAKGITVEWMTYEYPEYPQLYPPFDPQLSVLDLLLMTGPAAGQYIWKDGRDSAV